MYNGLMKATTELRKFVSPEVITGIDARLLIDRYLSFFESKKPLIVTDHTVQKQTWFSGIIETIKKQVPRFIVFADVSENPKDIEVHKGLTAYINNNCDVIVAIGGGSPIDCAKGIAIMATNTGNILDYEGVDTVKIPGPPLCCIPTTSGASADVSQFAIINDTKRSLKIAIISKKLIPDIALIDPVPLMTMDPYLTACTGMDALTHAIEAYVSNASSAITDTHALEAIRLISETIEKAITKERTIEDMHRMMMASTHAGFAFSNASLGAVHALAHSLGGLLGLAHGECNSILLEHVIDYNFDAEPERYKNIALKMNLAVNNLNDNEVKKILIEKIRGLRNALGIPAKKTIPTKSEKILSQLAQSAYEDPCLVTNPKAMSIDTMKELYEQILE